MASNPYSNQLISALTSGLKSPNSGAIAAALQSSQQQQNAANKANQQRYDQGLGILQGGHTAASGLLQSATDQIGQNGQAGMNRIGLQEQKGLGNVAQSAVSRGLTNTTISDAMNRGVQRDANDARLNLQESINSQQAQAKTAQATEQLQGPNNIANFIANRNDLGPDTSLLAQLTQGAASDASNAKRTGSVTRQTLPGLAAKAQENGLPSSFGGGAGAPVDYSKLGYSGNGSGNAIPGIPGITPAGGGAGDIASALAPQTGGGSPGSVTQALGIPYTAPPSADDQASMWQTAITNAQKNAAPQVAAQDAHEAQWVSKPGGGFYSKSEWEGLTPQQRTNVASGRSADQAAS